MACCLLSREKIILKPSMLFQLQFFASQIKEKKKEIEKLKVGLRNNPVVLICKASWALIMIAGNFDVIKVSTRTHMEKNITKSLPLE